MSEPIGVGDYVECVDASYCPELVEQKVYLVEAIELGYDDEGALDCGLRIAGVNYPRGGWPYTLYDAIGFRPIYRPKASLIQSLLSDTPADFPVEA